MIKLAPTHCYVCQITTAKNLLVIDCSIFLNPDFVIVMRVCTKCDCPVFFNIVSKKDFKETDIENSHTYQSSGGSPLLVES